MAKNTKGASNKKNPAKPKLSATALVAVTNAAAQPADINFVFKAGLGQATASLFRKGVLINMQSVSASGTIHFSDVQTGDAISINGICTGTCTITISVDTTPATPDNFPAGIIMTGYLVN